MIELLEHTLKGSGKWSRKSLTAFASFWFGIIYEFGFPWWGFHTKEYVFITLMSLAGGTLWLTVKDKQNEARPN